MIFKGFVSRDKFMLSKAYITYVRPLLEYFTQIDHLHMSLILLKLEKFRNTLPEEFLLSVIYHTNSDFSV